jgi:hypothetical protein
VLIIADDFVGRSCIEQRQDAQCRPISMTFDKSFDRLLLAFFPGQAVSQGGDNGLGDGLTGSARHLPRQPIGFGVLPAAAVTSLPFAPAPRRGGASADRPGKANLARLKI